MGVRSAEVQCQQHCLSVFRKAAREIAQPRIVKFSSRLRSLHVYVKKMSKLWSVQSTYSQQCRLVARQKRFRPP